MIWRRCASRSASRWRVALHLAGELDAARRAPQRLGEQELVPAVRAVELQLRRLVVALQLAHVVLDPGQQLAALVAALRLRHQPLLELHADVAALAEPCGWPVAPGPEDTGPAAAGRGQLPGRHLAGRHLVRRRAVDRLARHRSRLGLRPWPPAAPALRQRIGNRQAERSRSARGEQRRLVRIAASTCSGSLAKPKFPGRAGRAPNPSRTSPSRDYGFAGLGGQCSAIAAPGAVHGLPRLDVAWESADKARHARRAHTGRKYSVRHYCNELAEQAGARPLLCPIQVTERTPRQ